MLHSQLDAHDNTNDHKRLAQKLALRSRKDSYVKDYFLAEREMSWSSLTGQRRSNAIARKVFYG